MELYDTVRRLLEQCPGEHLCDACLAFACSVSLTEMRTASVALARLDAFERGPAMCGSCRRQTTAIVARPVAKCVHCSRPIGPGEEPFVVEDDVFHLMCWRVLISDDRIRVSRALGRQSRALIDQSRALLRREAGRPVSSDTAP